MDIRSDSSVCFVCVCVCGHTDGNICEYKRDYLQPKLKWCHNLLTLFSSTYMAYFLQQNPKQDLKQNNAKLNETKQTKPKRKELKQNKTSQYGLVVSLA